MNIQDLTTMTRRIAKLKGFDPEPANVYVLYEDTATVITAMFAKGHKVQIRAPNAKDAYKTMYDHLSDMIIELSKDLPPSPPTEGHEFTGC